jgi:hypothetical protein
LQPPGREKGRLRLKGESVSRIVGERAYPRQGTDPPLAYTPSLEARFMFTRKLRSAQGDSLCKQCHGKGVVRVPGVLYSIDAAVACSCDAGNALWGRVLKIANQAQEEAG